MTPCAARVVAEARGWIGTPYVHQASLRGVGADCLGLLRGVWRSLYGAEPVTMPGYTPDWGEAGAREMLADAAARWLHPAPSEAAGDVILFRMRDGRVAKHLGIATAIGAQAAFVHAYDGHGVVEQSLSAPWARRIAGRFVFPEGEK